MPNNHKYAKNPRDKTYNADLAYIDDLTGIYNRRYLNVILPKEISKVEKENKKLSFFMMDCDNLKNINDTYGHLGGDRVLVEIANTLTKEINKEGRVIRYAGDEFTVVLPGKGLKESLKVADRLLQLISECKVKLKDGKKLSNISLSIGVAVYPDDADNAEGLIDKADQALYSAKRTGKNKISTVHDLVIEVHDRNLVLNALPCKEFINREREIELLKKDYDSAKKGAKKFILIKGEQGIGKTRLMLELFNSDKKYSRFLLKCRRENLDQLYGAISNALNGFLDFMEAREVLNVLTPLSDIDKYALASIVDKIKDLPIRYSKDGTPSTKELHEEDIFSAFINFIKELKLKIIPLLVDDILWIDRGSLKVIKWILDEEAATSVLIVGTLPKNLRKTQAAQKAPFAEFSRNEHIRGILETINLEPFTEDAVSELLKAVFSGPLLPPDVVKKISRMSWGFPSNVEEIIKYLLDSKIVYPKKGKWILDEKRLNKIPTSLKDLLNKRISGLDDESREVLSKAAILGNDFDTDILGLFHGKNEGELLDILDRLKGKGILQQSLLSGEPALSFVNNVIKENLYNKVEKKQLQQLHGKVAELLENYDRFDINKVYGKLRHHLKEAGETDKLKSFAGKYDLPSYVKTAIAEEEVVPSIEEIIEAPLSEKSEKLAPEIIPSLRAAWVNSQLYPRDNRTRMDSIENLYTHIINILKNDQTLTVTASGENIIINGRLISKRKASVMLSHSLAALFSDYDINGITFKRGVYKRELDDLFSFISEKQDYIEEAGGFTKLLKENRIANIKIDEVGYGKESDLAIKSKKMSELFKKVMSKSSAIEKLFSIDDKGLAVNEKMLSDSKKAIDSIIAATTAITKQDIDKDNKSSMILEGLYKTVGELAEKDAAGWKREKTRLGELFLSLDPLLRTKIIKESSYRGNDIANFVIDILSGLDKKDIAKILHEGWFKSGMLPEQLNEFLEIILKSQYPKNLSYEEIQGLFKKAGIEEEFATKLLNTVFTKSFFDKMAKELVESEKPESWERKSIDNLKPLTEALIIKGDIKTIEKLIKSILVKMESTSPSLRISTAEGIGKILEALIEREVFDISATIGTELSKCLRKEENINVYIVLLKDLEMMLNALMQKQNLSLLAIPLAAMKEELTLPDQRPVEFRSYAEGTLDRITSPTNMELLLLSFRKKAEKDYLPVIDLLAQLGKKVLVPLMELISTKDDAKLDPFEIYMRKRNIALIMQKIGEEAIPKLGDSLNDKRPFVVKNIIEILGYINDKSYLPYLERITKHPDEEVRREALSVLKKLKGKH